MSGTGIFRKVLNIENVSDGDFYAIEELSEEEKKRIDALHSDCINEVWHLDENDEQCIQQIYYEISCNSIFQFTHKGFTYDFDYDCDEKNPDAWRIRWRDLSDPKFAYNYVWETEPYEDYPDLPSLIFEFRLKNDGRTIAEYVCDYWKQPRLLVSEPINEELWRNYAEPK